MHSNSTNKRKSFWWVGWYVLTYEDWHESLLFIYYGQKVDLKYPGCDLFLRQGTYSNILYPDCFAFQLSPNYAFTTSSCFMNLERISKMLENHETHESIMDRIFSRNDMKSSIETFNVVQVFARYFTWSVTKLDN